MAGIRGSTLKGLQWLLCFWLLCSYALMAAINEKTHLVLEEDIEMTE